MPEKGQKSSRTGNSWALIPSENILSCVHVNVHLNTILLDPYKILAFDYKKGMST